jgi:hypothetical protein
MRVVTIVATISMLGVGCGRIDFDPLVLDSAPLADAPPDAEQRPFAFVQRNDGDGGGANVFGVPFASPVAAGNLVIATFDFDAASAFSSAVVDSLGNSYSMVGPFSNGTNHQFIAYAVTTAAGDDTVTVTLQGTSESYLEVRIHEYAGAWPADPLDSSAGANGSSVAVDGAQTPPFVTTQTNELVFGLFIFGAFGTSGTNFTPRSTLAGDVTEDRLATDPGPNTVTATMLGGSSWTACGATFFTH